MTGGAILFLALLLDAALGEPPWLWRRLRHPAVLMGAALSGLDQSWNSGSARRIKGAAALAIVAGLATLAGYLLSLAGWAVDMVFAAILLAQRSLVDHVRAVADGLSISRVQGQRAVARIVSRDTAEMDGPQIARGAIESAAENLSDAVLAPAFWFLVAGLPGMMFYKAVNTADSMIGYRNPRYAQFGWAAARLDDLLNLIPARLTALAISAAAGTFTNLRAIARDARAHRSPNAGWPEAAMARALNVALAGPRSYDGQTRDLAWVNGEGRRDIGTDEIDAAIGLLWRTWRILLVVALAVAILCGLSLSQEIAT